MKSIAITTMVYDDDLYLRIWLDYWERFVSRSSLYVLIHADYEHYEELAKGCNTIRIARPSLHSGFEVNRWRMLSGICSGLTYMFDRVIYTDVDELIVLDPKIGDNPVEYILGLDEPVIAPFGVDVVESPVDNLPPIDLSRPILSQRNLIAPLPLYNKPCITSRPIRWGSGGHDSDCKDVALSEHLFLFHLRLFDKQHYRTRAMGRKAMVTDPATGLDIKGLGGVTWTQLVEFSEYSIKKPDPLGDIRFNRYRRRWRMEPVLKNGLWQRRKRIYKDLYRLPERFEQVF